MAAAVAVAEQAQTEYAPASPEATQYASTVVQAEGGFRPEGSLQSQWVLRSDDANWAHPEAGQHGAPALDDSARAAMSSPSVVNRSVAGAPLHCYGPGEKVHMAPPQLEGLAFPAPGKVTEVINSTWSEWNEGPAKFDGAGWSEWKALPAGVSGDLFHGGNGPEWKQGKSAGGNFGFSNDTDGWVVHGYSGDVQALPPALAEELTVSPPFWGPGAPPQA